MFSYISVVKLLVIVKIYLINSLHEHINIRRALDIS